MELTSNGHAYGQSAYHFVFVPKYRVPVFRDPDIKGACEHIIRRIALEHKFKIHALQIEHDHVYLFVNIPHTYSVSYAIQLLKGTSSRFIRQQCPRLMHYKHFWSCGKFYRSVGNVTGDVIKHYIIESQGKSKFRFTRAYASRQLPS